MSSLDHIKDIIVLATEESVYGSTILCPKCGFNYNHMSEPTTVPGNDNYDANWGGRGDLLVVPMECEEGHSWELCLGFHKGNISIFARLVKRKRSKGK